ncbi:MAG: tetratricopeptide repeat protein, partial [Gammaproteobacteria bacterium]|nr:tetratricopeptide repeat protein [Gammaproteobacteria bacterium]
MQRNHNNRPAFAPHRALRSALLCLLLLSAGALNTVEAGWFKNSEQEAAQKYENGEYTQAAEEFTDSYRRGVALYHAGRYTDAAEAFDSVERNDVKADALYNLGNSRFKRSDYQGAVEAYQQSLKLRASDEDTLHNLSLAKKMVEQYSTGELIEEPAEEPPEEEPEQPEQKQEDEQQEQHEQQESEESSGEQQQESEESSGEQQQESEESSGEQQQESKESS